MKNQLITNDINSISKEKNINSHKIYLKNDSGEINTSKIEISEDIFLYKINSYLERNTLIEYSSEENNLCLDFTLKGNIKYYNPNLNRTIFKSKNSMFIEYINSSNCIFETDEKQKIENIGITIKGNFLNDFLLSKLKEREQIEKNYSENISTLLKKTKTNLKTSILLDEIYNCPFENELKIIFLQSKVYEIIYNEFNTLLSKDNNIFISNIKLSNEDINALYKAKDLICKDKYFLSIPQLAKKVALNEFKLKYGFKKLFNSSPGALILEQRMQKAKKLLEASEFNINEISKIVGYKYVQSFTTAFIKRFKQRPKDIMKKRNYYY